jgi:hypothetical protein
MPLQALTDPGMKRLPALADRDDMERPVYFWDPTYPGLGVRLNRDDSITWVIKVRIGGKVHWKNIGAWPDMEGGKGGTACLEARQFLPCHWKRMP